MKISLNLLDMRKTSTLMPADIAILSNHDIVF